MEQVVAFGPPPLPPKTRRSPPDSATTVLSSSTDTTDVFGYSSTNGIRQEITNSNSSTTATTGNHVVKIRINPDETISASSLHSLNGDILCNSSSNSLINHSELTTSPCIRINVNSDNEMIQNVGISSDTSERSYFYYSPFNCNTIMSSGQVSPSDTLDSGTCSDLDSTPPPLPSKKSKNSGVTVTVIGAQHKRAPSLTSSGADADSDDNESNISCDSLNSGELPISDDKPAPAEATTFNLKECTASAFLPQGLLKDIRDRSVKLSQPNSRLHSDEDDQQSEQPALTHGDESTTSSQQQHAADDDREEQTLQVIVEECTYQPRQRQQMPQEPAANNNVPNRITYETDKFINFHLNEMIVEKVPELKRDINEHEDESFVGFKDLLENEGSSTIRSAKGTIRGVKNRVRAGIATFLNINDQTKTYKEKDAGKVVVYTTTMGIVRETYNSCMKVKQILRTQLVKFEERDVFMSTDYQAEIRDRMRCDYILVPQVFVDGQHIGDAETIEKLNETGELRRILKPYKSMDACTTCKVCGGYNLLPCPVCNGSKKSVHRNHFTTEFVALKCMNCDEVGLVKCTSCAL